MTDLGEDVEGGNRIFPNLEFTIFRYHLEFLRSKGFPEEYWGICSIGDEVEDFQDVAVF